MGLKSTVHVHVGSVCNKACFVFALAVMAFVTYILVAGLVMGTQNR